MSVFAIHYYIFSALQQQNGFDCSHAHLDVHTEEARSWSTRTALVMGTCGEYIYTYAFL